MVSSSGANRFHGFVAVIDGVEKPIEIIKKKSIEIIRKLIENNRKLIEINSKPLQSIYN